MVAGFGRRYRVRFPDGGVSFVTLLGPVKEPGEVVSIYGRWQVERVVEAVGEDLDYELDVAEVDDRTADD
jgi:hypothetical protein